MMVSIYSVVAVGAVVSVGFAVAFVTLLSVRCREKDLQRRFDVLYDYLLQVRMEADCYRKAAHSGMNLERWSANVYQGDALHAKRLTWEKETIQKRSK